MEEIQPVSPGPINVRISVAAKVAQNDSPEVTLVCGNTDQWVTFSFFEPEWNAYPVKTARFVYFRGGRLQHTDVPFTGAAAPVPLLTQITEVFVGVYAGSLCATTPARVGCLSSIVCNSGGDIPANSEAYAQVLACISRAVYATEAAAASIRGACSTRLELIPNDTPGGTLRVWLDGRIPEGSALAVYRRTANSVSFRHNRWNCDRAGYSAVASLPFWGQYNRSEILREYPQAPEWMPNGGYFRNYFPLIPENIAAGYFDIPGVYNWLLPMVKPGYDYENDCFDWHKAKIIGTRYHKEGSLKAPAEFGVAIVQPVEGVEGWDWGAPICKCPILGRWKNTMCVFGRGGDYSGATWLLIEDIQGNFHFGHVTIIIR